MLLLIFPFLLNLHAAEPVSSCTFEAVTDNCRAFSPDGPLKIQVSENTFIPNYSAISASSKSSGEARAEQNEKTQAELERQNALALFRITETLNKIPKSKMSGLFKFAMAQNHSILRRALVEKPQESDKDEKMSTYWPPHRADGQDRTITVAEFRQGLVSLFTPQQRKEISEAVNLIAKNKKEGQLRNQEMRNPLAAQITMIAPKRATEVAELERQARLSVVRALVGERPERDWTPAEAAAVAKVKSITFRPGTEADIARSPSCEGLKANAFYVPATHSINLCPNFYNMPDSNLISVLAHEIGHAIDPCNCQHPTYKINGEKIRSILTPDGRVQRLPDEDVQNAAEMLIRTADRRTGHTANYFADVMKDPSKMEFFTKSGILTQVSAPVSVRNEGDQFRGYVLNDVYQCLVRNGFRPVTTQEVSLVASQVVAQRKAISNDQYSPERDHERIVAAFEANPQCYGPQGKSQMTEAIADWLGTQALADYLEKNPPKTREEQLATVADLAASVCMERSRIEETQAPPLAIDVIDSTMKALRKEADAHPADKARIERIAFADPRVVKAMGCGKPKHASCTHDHSSQMNRGEQSRTAR